MDAVGMIPVFAPGVLREQRWCERGYLLLVKLVQTTKSGGRRVIFMDSFDFAVKTLIYLFFLLFLYSLRDAA